MYQWSARGADADSSSLQGKDAFANVEIKGFSGPEEGSYLRVCSVTTFSRLEDASICAYADCELSKIACALW